MTDNARSRTVSRATKVRAARVFVAASEKCGRDDVPQWVREMAQEDPDRAAAADDIAEIERAAPSGEPGSV